MTYEELLDKAHSENLIVKEKHIPGYKGRIYKNRIAIHDEIETTAERACVLAEELGHYYTSVGDILDQTGTENRKQEYHARLHAYNSQIGLIGIIRCFEHGCRTLYETAEYLEVSEGFLTEALEAYRSKYSPYAVVDNYMIWFEPYLNVVKMI